MKDTTDHFMNIREAPINAVYGNIRFLHIIEEKENLGSYYVENLKAPGFVFCFGNLTIADDGKAYSDVSVFSRKKDVHFKADTSFAEGLIDETFNETMKIIMEA